MEECLIYTLHFAFWVSSILSYKKVYPKLLITKMYIAIITKMYIEITKMYIAIIELNTVVIQHGYCIYEF